MLIFKGTEITKSLCHVLGANIELYVNCASEIDKQTHRQRDQICGYLRHSVSGVGKELKEGSKKVLTCS